MCFEVIFVMDKHVNDELLIVEYIDNTSLPYQGIFEVVIA
jgi:hypothetical protein